MLATAEVPEPVIVLPAAFGGMMFASEGALPPVVWRRSSWPNLVLSRLMTGCELCRLDDASRLDDAIISVTNNGKVDKLEWLPLVVMKLSSEKAGTWTHSVSRRRQK